MKKITIIIDNEKMKFDVSNDITFPEVVQSCLTAIQAASDQVLKHVPKNQEQSAREDMADMFNSAVTYVMDNICPPDEDNQLTEVAILKAENEMVLEAATRKVPLSQVLKEHRERAQQDRLKLINNRPPYAH